MARTQTWTAAAREVERERTRQIARIGSNLNQIARWAAHPCGRRPRGRRGSRPPGRHRARPGAAARAGRGRCWVKFLAHGTGSAQAAADYLTRELDSQGEVRDDVAVLRGDPDAVAAVADTLEFEHKYTSGVIAWAPEDRPSDQDIDRVLDEFEQTAWAGLAPDSLRLGGGAAPRGHRRRARACAHRAVRPGDRQEPQHRAAGAGSRPTTPWSRP